MYLLYSAALAIAAALALPYFFVQGVRHGKYLGTFRSRWGRLPQELGQMPEQPSARESGGGVRLDGAGTIWLHAVSVGEVLACPRLVAELRAQLPGRRILVSTTTATGQEAARKRLAADDFFYCPFDFAFAVRRVVASIRPAMLVVVETELWPNLLREVRAAGAKVAVVNARISDRSFPRYRALRFFFRHVLSDAGLLLAQSQEDARRLREMGAPAESVRVTGSLKYDQAEPAPLPDWLSAALTSWTADGALLAGSTAEGEEEHVLKAWAGLRVRRPNLRLILAPRRPERFDRVADLLRARGLAPARRSQLVQNAAISGDVLLVDTMGELAAMYRYAEVAFVGGSLVEHGGQNPLEAAWFAKPAVVGPSVSNFREITATLLASKAIRQIRSADELPAAMEALLMDRAGASAMGQRARGILEANRGATARTVDALVELLSCP
jgi:3-deoxy-D-manno-octulosonic-acid transferase